MAKKQNAEINKKQELLTYRIFTDKRKRYFFISKNHRDVYQINDKEIKQIRWFQNRFLIAIVVFLVLNGFIHLNYTFSLLFGALTYGVSTLIFNNLYVKGLTRHKMAEADIMAFLSDPDFVSYETSLHLIKGGAGILLTGLFIFGMPVDVQRLDRITFYICSAIAALYGIYHLYFYFKDFFKRRQAKKAAAGK